MTIQPISNLVRNRRYMYIYIKENCKLLEILKYKLIRSIECHKNLFRSFFFRDNAAVYCCILLI